jgi:hypothetical protein
MAQRKGKRVAPSTRAPAQRSPLAPRIPSSLRSADKPARWNWPWIAIWTVAVALRLIHYWQIHATDLATTLLGDAKVYDDWGNQIAAGR